ncbi:YppE family protein [Chryseomicrobium palamuruense]|uniref:YppE family protein n=1 Tax=Chryseomicrobium palamuruense TaxID=682973 RepID=A0ABV8UTG6_9BACL
MRLQQINRDLLDECHQCISRFESMRELDAVADFYKEVRPHTLEFDQLIAEWKELAIEYINEHQPKYVHLSQIESAEEQMKQFIVQSFYKETSKKRFYQSIHAAIYTLETIQTELKGGLS